MPSASGAAPGGCCCVAARLSGAAAPKSIVAAAHGESPRSREVADPGAAPAPHRCASRCRCARQAGAPRHGARRQPLLDSDSELRIIFWRAIGSNAIRSVRFPGDPVSDSAALLFLESVGAGIPLVDGWATPPSFEFTAVSDTTTIGAGETIAAGKAVTLHVRSNAPGGYETIVLKGTEPLRPGPRMSSSSQWGATRPCTASRFGAQTQWA